MRVKSKFFISLLTASTVFLLVGHGCGNFGSSDPNLVGLNSGESDEDFVILSGAKTTSVVYAKQFLNNMVSCTGLKNVDPRTIAEFEVRKTNISEYGYATEVTGPALMSIAAVAGEVCSDLIEQDSSRPNIEQFFSSINFSEGPSSMSNSDLEIVLKKLSLSCWQRNITSEETGILIDGLLSIAAQDSNANSPAATHNIVLTACTSMLASLSAIEM